MVRSLVSWSCFSLTDVCPVLLLSSDRERKSGRPLMVSLALELLSRNLRRTPSNSSALERQEYARRDRDLFWYLFRGSIWESWTRYDISLSLLRLCSSEVYLYSPKLESVADASERWPILNILSPFLRDWMPLVDEYYYCESKPLSHSYLAYPLAQIHPRSLGHVLVPCHLLRSC
jgi:peroxin-16